MVDMSRIMASELHRSDSLVMELAQDEDSHETKYRICYKNENIPTGFTQSDYDDKKIDGKDTVLTIDILEQLGEGGFGITYAATLSGSKGMTKICIKRNKKRDTYESVAYECNILKDIEADVSTPHDSIVRFLFTCTTSYGNCYLGLEYFEGYDLLKYIKDEEKEHKDHFPNKYTKLIAEKSLEAIDYLHNRGIYHCDIKPANILFHVQKDRIRLIDFGLAKQRYDSIPSDHLSCHQGTCAYMPPEVLIKKRLTDLSDVYGLGATLLHLSTLRTPWDGFIEQPNNREQIIDALDTVCSCHGLMVIQHKLLENYSAIPDPLKSVIVDMLHKDERKRISCRDALNQLANLHLELEKQLSVASMDSFSDDGIPVTVFETSDSSFGKPKI